METSDWIAGAGVLIAAVGTWLANRRAKASEGIARQALDGAKRANEHVVWSNAIEAAQRIVGLDPITEVARDPLVNLRVASSALVDELDEWTGMDRWLAVEHVLGSALGREVMERHRPEHDLDQRLVVLEPFHKWAAFLSQNLRLLRKTGYDAAQMQEMEAAHLAALRDVYARNGWGEPDLNYYMGPPPD